MTVVTHVHVRGCARCGEDHEHLEFQRFLSNPPEINGQALTHYGTCPVTLEPILLAENFERSTEPEGPNPARAATVGESGSVDPSGNA